MKHLLTLVLFASGLNAIAQFPNLPYNPDENGDGLIGVVDLQGLLANYGNEFSSAVVSENQESAIMYMGDMAYPLCAMQCDNLPGRWRMPFIEDLAPVWDEVYTEDYVITWLGQRNNRIVDDQYRFDHFFSYEASLGTGDNHAVAESASPIHDYRCYCAAKQLPRVEYTYCEGTDIQECANEKVGDGWYPLEGITKISYNGQNKIQAFWRWAE